MDGYYLNQGIIECDIGDMRLSFVDANFPNAFDGPVPHFHSVFELQYVKSGKLIVKNNVKTVSLTGGEFILLPPNFFHRTETEDLERYALLFSISPISEGAGSFSEYEYYSSLLNGTDDFVVERSEELASIIDKITEIGLDAKKAHRLKILLQMLFLTLTDMLSQKQQSKGSSSRKAKGCKSSRAALRGILDDYISINYAEEGMIEKISNLLHMSRRNTTRVINDIFGASLSELIIRQRMNCALVFITESDMTLSEIADRVGYNSYSAFYKAFVKYFGASPDSYRV